MYCNRKGKECPDCTTFGECFRMGGCGLPDKYPTTTGSLGSSYSYGEYVPTNTLPDELYINGIKYVREK